MPRAFISLGSNMGQPLSNLQEALVMAENTEGIKVIAVSSVYLTEPVGFADQPWFYNSAAEIETTLSPEQLLKALQNIEQKLGRVRTVHWGPRTIDLDILLYDNNRIDSEELTIPHPRMTERAFVVVPLSEIAGSAMLPDGQSVRELVGKLKNIKKCICIPDKLW